MIDTTGLARMLDHTRRLRVGFATTAPKPWDGATAGAELTVQLGHLAQCIARRYGIDLPGFQDLARPITQIGDELADVALAALSITTLTGDRPPVPPADVPVPGGTTDDLTQLLILIVVAGRLTESAMVTSGYRHRPTGDLPAVPEAAGTVLAVADRLGALVGVNLAEEFEAMVADATGFLAAHTADPGSDRV